MGKKSGNKMLHEIYEGAVCASECTGLLQNISVDPEEIKRFHEEYIGK
jgi:hypothetical protein